MPKECRELLLYLSQLELTDLRAFLAALSLPVWTSVRVGQSNYIPAGHPIFTDSEDSWNILFPVPFHFSLLLVSPAGSLAFTRSTLFSGVPLNALLRTDLKIIL